MPGFKAVYEEKQGQFELISVAVDDNSDPRGIVSQSGYGWTFALDQGGAQKYGVQGIPMTVFIDRQGNEVTRFVGGMDRATFESKLAQIL